MADGLLRVPISRGRNTLPVNLLFPCKEGLLFCYAQGSVT